MKDKLTELNEKQAAKALPRAQRALKLRRAGATWAAIGVQLKVSKQRAQQLAAKAAKSEAASAA